MPFQTLQHIVVSGRTCPSMIYHIILGLGRAWKGIEMYNKGHDTVLFFILTLKDMPFQKHLHNVMSGRARPSLNQKHCNHQHHWHDYMEVMEVMFGEWGRKIIHLEYQNPQSAMKASSGRCEHHLVCQRLLTILRSKGRIRNFVILPNSTT